MKKKHDKNKIICTIKNKWKIWNIYDKGLTCTIYKELLTHEANKMENFILELAKYMSTPLKKWEANMATKHMKRYSISLRIR